MTFRATSCDPVTGHLRITPTTIAFEYDFASPEKQQAFGPDGGATEAALYRSLWDRLQLFDQAVGTHAPDELLPLVFVAATSATDGLPRMLPAGLRAAEDPNSESDSESEGGACDVVDPPLVQHGMGATGGCHRAERSPDALVSAKAARCAR